MNIKAYILNFIFSAVIFTVGRIVIGANLGRLGVISFMGYVFCVLAILIAVCTTAVIIALRNEENNNERTDN